MNHELGLGENNIYGKLSTAQHSTAQQHETKNFLGNEMAYSVKCE